METLKTKIFNFKYLGITFDHTLSLKTHLENTAAKFSSRNNIIQKLCGISWGASAHILRCLAPNLIYPVVEYCASVWLNSSPVTKVDTQFNTYYHDTNIRHNKIDTHSLALNTNSSCPPPLRRGSV